MHIKINNIRSLNPPESFEIKPDDRMSLIQTYNGNTVEDYGHISSGDIYTLTGLTFKIEDFNQIYTWWANRNLVDFTDTNDTVWQGMRLKLEKYSYREKFKDYVKCDITLWRI